MNGFSWEKMWWRACEKCAPWADFAALHQGEKVRPVIHATQRLCICTVFEYVEKSMTYAMCVTKLVMRVTKFACLGCANLAAAKRSAAQIGCRQTSTIGGRGAPRGARHPTPTINELGWLRP
jgi:hypothetical protein